MKKKLTFLGIETSCDETAAAIIQENNDGSAKILSNIVSSQIKEHKKFGDRKRYLIEGTVEHDAHSLIQPILLESLSNAIKKDYPGWTPRFASWKKDLEKYPNLPDEHKYGGTLEFLKTIIKKKYGH